MAKNTELGESLLDDPVAETLAHYRHMAEFSLDGIVIADLEGNVLIANPAVLAMLELDSTTATRPLTVFDFIAPESMPEVRRDFSGMREDKKGIVRTYKAVSSRGNDRYVEVLGNRITFEGRPANIISVRDVTERKRMEESLRRSEEKYRLLAENSPDIITSLTPTLTVDYISPKVKDILGYEPHEVGGREILRVIHPDDHELVKHATQRVIDGNDTEKLEFRVLHRDGRTIWFETTTYAMRNDLSGELLELYNVSRDITQRKIAEDIAHRRDRVLHGFAVASGFLLTGRLENPFPRVLSTIGEALEADVSYIYEDTLTGTEGSHSAVRHYRWGKETTGTGSHRSSTGGSPGHRFPEEWSHRLASGVWISGCLSRIGGQDREVLEDLGIHSILLVPIFVGGAYWGFTGVSDLTTDRVWADTEIEILMTLASTLGLVFEKQLPGRE
jgi:PAS domain S-box-containing protein